MKITIAYQSEVVQEVQDAKKAETLIREAFPGVKVKFSDRNKPFFHINITKKLPATGTDSKKP